MPAATQITVTQLDAAARRMHCVRQLVTQEACSEAAGDRT